ncbi:MAG TPA: hypothetical protein VF691_21430, partial [Cytophagaceae bacterium]
MKPSLKFTYDGMGNRVKKEVNKVPYTSKGDAQRELENLTATYYVRDASGNVMAIYERTNVKIPPSKTFPLTTYNATFALKEVPLYGSDRLGEYQPDEVIATKTNLIKQDSPSDYVQGAIIDSSEILFTRVVNKKVYELKDHLGNARVMLSDAKKTIQSNTTGAQETGGGSPPPFIDEPLNQNAGVYAVVTGQNNYYAFGMQIPGKSFNLGSYRYGFN